MSPRDDASSNEATPGEFAGWPKLESCPTCRYNLTGLTPGRPCPECGWGEGHLGVFLPAWSSKSAVDGRLRNHVALALLFVGLLLACSFITSWWGLVALIAAIVLPTWIARLLIPRSRRYDTQIIPFEDGVLIHRAGQQPVREPWTYFSGVSLYSRRGRFHELIVTKRDDVLGPRLGEYVVLEGSIDEVKNSAQTLRARIKRAAMDRDQLDETAQGADHLPRDAAPPASAD